MRALGIWYWKRQLGAGINWRWDRSGVYEIISSSGGMCMWDPKALREIILKIERWSLIEGKRRQWSVKVCSKGHTRPFSAVLIKHSGNADHSLSWLTMNCNNTIDQKIKLEGKRAGLIVSVMAKFFYVRVITFIKYKELPYKGRPMILRWHLCNKSMRWLEGAIYSVISWPWFKDKPLLSNRHKVRQ